MKTEVRMAKQDRRGEGPAMEPLALRAKDAARMLGLGQRKLWELTNRGEVPCVRVDGCVLYPVGSLRRWLDEAAQAKHR